MENNCLNFLEAVAYRPGCAPLILLLLIDMCFMKKSIPQDKHCNAYFFEKHRMVQQILLLIALWCVPLILLGMPLYATVVYPRKRLIAEVS